MQSFTDDALTNCKACGGDLRKVFGAVGIAFKGSGFYKNDSRGAKTSGSGDKGSSDKGSGDNGSADKGSDKGSGSGDTSTTPKVDAAKGSKADKGAKSNGSTPAKAPASTSS